MVVQMKLLLDYLNLKRAKFRLGWTSVFLVLRVSNVSVVRYIKLFNILPGHSVFLPKKVANLR